jgi:carbamoyl-phosphate synthase large subunit
MPELLQLASAVADALDLYGHAVIQLIEEPTGELHIIECNPRFGGASTASLAKGLQSFCWFLLEAEGLEADSVLFTPFTQEVQQVRFPTDRVFIR